MTARMGIPSHNIAYVGDSDIDMQLARRAGMQGIGAGWGYKGTKGLREAGAEHCVESPLELLGLL